MGFTGIWVVSLIFWAVVAMLSGVTEPWDAASFWSIIYPAALALSVMLGAMQTKAQWAAGAMVMFAQIPVVMVASGASPLLGVGVIYAAILSIPAIALSWLGGRMRRL